jgi:hypothetical protein
MEPLRVDVEPTPIDDTTTEDDEEEKQIDAGGCIELEASKRSAYAIISCAWAGDYMRLAQSGARPFRY